MSRSRESYIALLRGVNVGGKHKIPMSELRSIFADLDCEGVKTYIQSGNVVFTPRRPAEVLEERVETAIAQRFGFTIPVLVRAASSWKRYVQCNPFPNESKDEANRVLLCLSRRPPAATAASELQQRAAQGEIVAQSGDAIWIYYASGIARSKLTPAMLDRFAGSPVTARNWRTVLKLQELVRHGD